MLPSPPLPKIIFLYCGLLIPLFLIILLYFLRKIFPFLNKFIPPGSFKQLFLLTLIFLLFFITLIVAINSKWPEILEYESRKIFVSIAFVSLIFASLIFKEIFHFSVKEIVIRSIVLVCFFVILFFLWWLWFHLAEIIWPTPMCPPGETCIM